MLNLSTKGSLLKAKSDRCRSPARGHQSNTSALCSEMHWSRNLRAQKIKLEGKAREQHFRKPASKIPSVCSIQPAASEGFVSPSTSCEIKIQNLGRTEVEGEGPKQITDYSPSNACRGEGSFTSTTDVQDRELPADPGCFSRTAAVLTYVPRPQAYTQSCNMSQSFCCSPLLPWSSSDKNSLSCGMMSNYTAWLLLASFSLAIGWDPSSFQCNPGLLHHSPGVQGLYIHQV